MSAYAELVAASNFSFLRGASRPEELAVVAGALEYKALAICDRNSVAGVVRANRPAKELRLKYIPGCRLVLQDSLSSVEPGPPRFSAGKVRADPRVGPGTTMKAALEIACLPTDRAAWGRLCRLLTCGNRRAPKAECHLWLDDLIRHAEGQKLILLPPWDAPPPAFAEVARDLAGRFPGHVFIGAALAFDGQDARRLARLAALSQHTGAPMVAIGDSLYHASSRKPLQDVLTCIREKCTIAEAGYRLQRNAERHLKHPAEIARLYTGYEDAVARTTQIADTCRFSLDELAYEYPDEPCEPFASPQEALVHYTNEGLQRHYPQGTPEKIAKQVAHELALIEQLDYARYFLTVFDLVRYARSRDILCQGRGSAANSAVCYCLGITGVNPDEIDLLFERFISAERGEPPDIDVDFEHERREEVIQHVYEKYGRDRAGIVATVITYRAKSAIREVGKALGLSEEVIGALSGMMWWWSSSGVEDKHIREIGLDPADRTLRLAVRLARELTGFPRHLSQHTGGFVITRGLLEDIVPIGNAAMPDRTFIEWDKDDLDQLGLLKIDVLALGMLTCIRKSFDLIKALYGETVTLANTPWDDAKVYEMICRADTVGVFQIESRAQMSMLPRLRPRKFYDLVIEVAIVRPGPIQGDMVHPYLRRRDDKEEVSYPSEALKEVLEKTLGVPLFQEQAMKIAIVAAGFTPGEADQLRRAMATFRHAGTIQTFGERLIEGMVANKYERDFAERCFRQIEGFGEYGFPESHAAAFALLAYVSSWIKYHHPDVFACALLNAQPMGFYAPAQIVRDFRDHHGEAREVDINHSLWDCTLEARAVVPSPLGGSRRRRVSEGYGLMGESGFIGESAPPHPVAAAPALSREGRGQEERDGSMAQPLPQAAAGPLSHGVRGGALSGVRNPSPGTLRAPHSPHGRGTDPSHLGGNAPHSASEGKAPEPANALRLGFRLVRGLAVEDATAIVKARGTGYTSLDDFAARTRLPVRKLRLLAEADAFRSIGLDRRQALWAVSRYAETGTTAALLERLPLFAATGSAPLAREAEVALPKMALGEHVLADYIAIRMSLKAHPMALLREDFSPRGYLPSAKLREIPSGRIVQVAGIVLIRQRPGTASGVIFSTIEDETGIANLIIWPSIFEKYRRIVLGARLLGVRGQLQSEQGVIHVVARELVDMSGHLARIADKSPSADDFLSPGDEVRRSVEEDGRTPSQRKAASFHDELVSQTLPKGRNFH